MMNFNAQFSSHFILRKRFVSYVLKKKPCITESQYINNQATKNMDIGIQITDTVYILEQ